MQTIPDIESLTRHQLLLGDAWREARDGQSYRVQSPVTGEDVAELAAAGPGDVDDAFAVATAAFLRHERTSAFERAGWCESVADVLDRRRDAIARELTAEHGKPLRDSVAEVASAATGFRLAAAEARRLGGETIPVADPHKRVLTARHPSGVWAVITPWNFPINIPVEYIGPALATGNAVVWKPAPSTSRVAVRLVECVVEAGVPPGLLNLVTGPSVETARHLVSHPHAIGVGFTGSTAVGEQVAAAAAGKRLMLELGGNGPVIVLGDADVERTAAAVGAAAFWNAGQSCAAAERVLAESPVHDALVETLGATARGMRLGDPFDEATDIGPVHNPATAAKMDEHVADAVAHGARVVAGGGRQDRRPTPLYYEPTVLENVAADARVQHEETFGPIAPLTRVDGDDAVLELACASLGLSAAIFTTDVARAMRLAERLRCGQVVINDTSNYWELHMPFGGWPGTGSGIGRVGGRYALEAMTEVRSIAIDVRPRP
jgi:acyl-CoA reductase-like NAD-dependent aldehyde dehydrogenase